MPKTSSYPFSRTLPEVVGDIRRKRPLPETGWYVIGPSNVRGVDFKNGFTGDTGSPPAWMLGADGFVRHKGIIIPPDSPTFPVVAWTFPVELRPQFLEPFLLGVKGGGYANGYVDVNGDVVIESITVPA